MRDAASREFSWVGEQAHQAAIDGTLMRGGTSKCWVFQRSHLPEDPAARDAVLVRLFGSPDHRQIDGVGGGTSTTSKVLVIDGVDPANRSVDYEVGQVSVDAARVEWESNCGNCASALALYAAQQGLVPLSSPTTSVTLANTRTGLVLEAVVDSPEVDRPPRDGAEVVPGTVFPGVRVQLRWSPPSWSEYGRTFPTGNPVDLLEVGNRALWCTLVDAGAPAVLVSAADLGIESTPPPRAEVEERLPVLMEVRRAAATTMGLPDAGLQSVPKVGIVGRSATEAASDVEARMVSMTALHPAIGITSAVAVAVAAGVKGTTVNDVWDHAQSPHAGRAGLTIGTLAGDVPLEIQRGSAGDVAAIGCVRSARRLVDATVHVGADWTELRNRQ